ncbi:MAG: hemolysin family protein [Treponema sp.]|nr:hemolysin family protein [Treponema sp.]
MANGDPLIWQLLLLLALILISGFFSCAEIALIALNKNKLEKRINSGDRQAKRILSITGRPSEFLATIQVGSILAGFLASAFAANTISARFSLWLVSLGMTIPAGTIATVSMVIITIILAFFQMVLGELVPKRLAMKKADVIAYPISSSILIISKIFAPLVWLLTKTTNGLLRILGIKAQADAHEVTEEEIRLMIDLGSARGTIKEGEKEILNNVFELDNKSAAEVMTHRRDAVMLWLEESDEEWEKTIIENKHSFFPVLGKSQDDIVGVLKSRDYLCLKDRSRQTVMAQAVRPAQLIPTSLRTDKLFRRMKKNRNHFALVLDEYGGTMGIITMKDLLEELVGSLDDDIFGPEEEPLIQKTGPDTWLVSGALSLNKAAEELAVSLPVERYDTFSGFVFSLLGRIPEDGEKAELETQGLRIKILDVREHRLIKAEVFRTLAAEKNQE